MSFSAGMRAPLWSFALHASTGKRAGLFSCQLRKRVRQGAVAGRWKDVPKDAASDCCRRDSSACCILSKSATEFVSSNKSATTFAIPRQIRDRIRELRGFVFTKRVADLLGWVAGLLGTGREFARVCSNRGAVGSQGVFERCSNGTLPSCRSTRRVLFFYSF